ncbi:MAG: ABC-F family ATP-binding cassette domain-containing protein [Myxococcota bacterium]|nr:ABC-F family ATP-binding cassette domain-containing protein [Myxococcota bacterium]
MPALSAQHLRKSFGSQVVLDDATFTLARGEKVGLIGANGAGKSTLARILAGLEAPDGGTLSTRRGLTVRYLAQEPELDPDMSAQAVVEDALTAWREATEQHAALTAELSLPSGTARTDSLLAEQARLDDAVARLGGWERGHEALSFLDRLGVHDVGRACGVRSGGERRRIALAQLLVASPDVAILDEPTNHLDADTSAWLEGFLARDFRGAIVVVTHDRYFLDAVATRIVELERGRLGTFAGGYTEYVEKKATIIAQEERVEQNRQNALRREREWLARGPKARATKQKARIQRAVELEARGPATAGRPGEVELLAAATPQQGKTILELKGLSLAPTAGAPALHDPLSLILAAGERIGVVGPNGVGKTTLLRAILAAVEESRRGERPADAPSVIAGSIVIGKNTRASYLDQARAELDDDKSIFDDVRGEGGTVVTLGPRESQSMDLRSYLELFLFNANKQRQKVGSLSGGERARVALAKILREGSNLLLLDEPTNDLDLPTLAALEQMLQAYQGSVVVITHDRAFLDRVATAILAFEPRPADGRQATVTRYSGGYADYVVQRARKREPRASPELEGALGSGRGAAVHKRPPVSAQAERGNRSKGAGALTHAERLELDKIIRAIEASEKRVADVSSLLADPSLYANRGHEVAGLHAQLATARAEATALIARWEALEARRGA